jgi:hypothetical protein
MGGESSFGHGSTDLLGQRLAARFVFDHADHKVRVEVSGATEGRRSDEYMTLDLDLDAMNDFTTEEMLEIYRAFLARTNSQIADIEKTVENLRLAIEKGDSK